MILDQLIALKGRKKAFAWLIDPDKCNPDQASEQIQTANQLGVDYVFVGGSLVFNHINGLLEKIKPVSRMPVILFPGSPLQVSSQADAILLLSLISGRNSEYLIGNHVVAAPFLRESGIEILPTGYILVNGGKQTSVSYMSNTQPIPNDKPDLALATAMAGEMLGLRIIFLDAGSGAIEPVPAQMIHNISSGVSVPLIVGGGLCTPEKVREAYLAGADMVVVGNAAEENPKLIEEMVRERDRFNN
jgi:putative glycerol-1-phosphate prenyltransferase